MSEDNAKDHVENIKNDIKSLINNLSKLKGGSSDILFDSLGRVAETISSVKSSNNNKLHTTPLMMKAITWFYSDAMKKAAISIGIAAVVIYLMKKKGLVCKIEIGPEKIRPSK